jgi:hypothetical protein
MKRKINNTLISNKKMKLSSDYIIDDSWISPSNIGNIILNDSLSYWLKYYKIDTLNSSPNKYRKFKEDIDLHTKYLMDKGIEYEEIIINKIKENHNVICFNNTIKDIVNPKKFIETVECMKRGDNIIYQGVLHCPINKFFGSPDLLVRSDYINKLFNYNYITDKKIYYIPIDIKNSTINLSKNNVNVLNSGRMKAYKSQLYIYNTILNNINGIGNNVKNYKSFIFPRNIKSDVKNNNNLESRILGEVNFLDYDSDLIEEINNSIKCCYKIRNEGHLWSLNNPCKELYPNKNINTSKLIEEYSIKIADITNIAYCGIKEREISHSKDVFRWDDIKFDSSLLNLNSKYKNNIDNIISINRDNLNKNMIPDKLTIDRKNWVNISKDTLEIFIDYETLSFSFGGKDNITSKANAFDETLVISAFNEIDSTTLKIKNSGDNMYIYMIGIVYKNLDTIEYKDFTVNNLSRETENNNMNDFEKYLKDIMLKMGKSKIKAYHWSSHEINCNNIFEEIHKRELFSGLNITFYDLRKLFEENKVAIKGCFNYKLKSISKALYNNKMIKTTWDSNSKCCNGMDAMVLALQIYEKNEDINNIIMKDIRNYNKIDCIVMLDILEMIREKY